MGKTVQVACKDGHHGPMVCHNEVALSGKRSFLDCFGVDREGYGHIYGGREVGEYWGKGCVAGKVRLGK